MKVLLPRLRGCSSGVLRERGNRFQQRLPSVRLHGTAGRCEAVSPARCCWSRGERRLVQGKMSEIRGCHFTVKTVLGGARNQ